MCRNGQEVLKFPTRESTPGQPLFAFLIESISQLEPGDHIVYQSSKPPFRIMYRSALVVRCTTDKVIFITNIEIGVTKKRIYFDELKNVHKIEYDECHYSVEKSLERAKRRLKLNEECYHALFNNSHFFVTLCKTGREYPLTDILVEISQGENICTLLDILSHSFARLQIPMLHLILT